MNQLKINKEIWGYNFESFLDQEIPQNIFQDDLKILNSEKFDFNEKELSDFLFFLKLDSLNTIYKEVHVARKRTINRETVYNDTRFQSARIRVIKDYIYKKQMFFNLFNFYLESNFSNDNPTSHKQLTVEVLEKMVLSLSYMSGSGFNKSLTEMLRKSQSKNYSFQLKDIIWIKETENFKDCMLVELDLDLPPDSNVFFNSFMNNKSFEDTFNSLGDDKFKYAKHINLDNKLYHSSKKSLQKDNQKVIFFLDKLFELKK
jgi:hypothetical protein